MMIEKMLEEMSGLTVDHYVALLAVELLCHGAARVLRAVRWIAARVRAKLARLQVTVDDLCDGWAVGA